MAQMAVNVNAPFIEEIGEVGHPQAINGVDYVLQVIGFAEEEEREGLVVAESEFVGIPTHFQLILVTAKSGHQNG